MEEQRHLRRTSAEGSTAYEPERRSLERAMQRYAAYLRSVERYQKSVASFRRLRDAHETMHGLLRELAENRESAAAGRVAVRAAVRMYMQRLRDDDRAPEVAVRMLKGTCRTIVGSIPEHEALRNPDALLEDTVRWAIEAYYDAA